MQMTDHSRAMALRLSHMRGWHTSAILEHLVTRF